MMTDNKADFDLFKTVIFDPEIITEITNPVYEQIGQNKDIQGCYKSFKNFTNQAHEGLGVFKMFSKKNYY